METNMLLDTYLKELRLPTFLRNYRKFAEEAAQADHSYDRFLGELAIVPQEGGESQLFEVRVQEHIRFHRSHSLEQLVVALQVRLLGAHGNQLRPLGQVDG